MATHSSILAWELPWTEEPGGLQAMGSQSRTRQHAQTTMVCVMVCASTRLYAVLCIFTFTLFFRKLVNSEGFRNGDL